MIHNEEAMLSKFIAGRVLLGSALMLGASFVVAQAAPQAAAFGGPTIAGVCILNQQALFSNSKVGIDASAQYKKMRDSDQAGVNAEEAKILADAKALQAKKLQGPQLQQAQQQLAKRMQDLRAKAAKKTQDLEATRRAAVDKISAVAQPIIKQAYDQRKCGILIARASILAGNASMDLTSAVVGGLDAKVTTIPLDNKTASAPKR